MTEARALAVKRLSMRSMRRGIKEMDLILSAFAAAELAALPDDELALYERLLEENDQELYRWVSGQDAPPADYAGLIARIAAGATGIARPA